MPPPPPDESGRNDGSNTGSTSNEQSSANGQQTVRWCLPGPAWLPLSDEASSLFLSKVADTLVMGLFTLATFSATYLLAWGSLAPIASQCSTALSPTTLPPVARGSKNPGLSGQQLLFGLLPLAILPIALISSGLAKIAETDKRALSFVSAICFCEFTFAIALGGVMSHCMTGAPFYLVLGVTVCLIFVMGVIWRLTFRHPKCVSSQRCEDDGAAIPQTSEPDSAVPGADDGAATPQTTGPQPTIVLGADGAAIPQTAGPQPTIVLEVVDGSATESPQDA